MGIFENFGTRKDLPLDSVFEWHYLLTAARVRASSVVSMQNSMWCL